MIIRLPVEIKSNQIKLNGATRFITNKFLHYWQFLIRPKTKVLPHWKQQTNIFSDSWKYEIGLVKTKLSFIQYRIPQPCVSKNTTKKKKRWKKNTSFLCEKWIFVKRNAELLIHFVIAYFSSHHRTLLLLLRFDLRLRQSHSHSLSLAMTICLLLLHRTHMLL